MRKKILCQTTQVGVENGMAELPEVFLPYAITLGGRTLYAEVKEHRLGGFLPAVGSP